MCICFILQTLKYLGDVHVALKNKPQAEKFYTRALHILKKRLGSTDETVKQLEQYIKQLNLKDLFWLDKDVTIISFFFVNC